MSDSTSNTSQQRPISDHLGFTNLVVVLEKISKADSNVQKKKYLKKYFDFIRERFKDHHKTLDSEKAGGDSLYCVIRIFLPDLDRGRRAYGFKSSSLGRMFAQILGLDKSSRDGKSLIEFKNPRRAGSSAGNIADIIFSIMDKRFSAKATDSTNQVKLKEIHDTLDRLSKGADSDVNQEQQKKILQVLIRKLTPIEGKWLVHILLKDLHLGFSSTKNAVYELLHPQAKNLTERIGDLEMLCQKLNDPAADVDDIDILIFNHFRPMLATRMDIIDSVFEGGGSIDESTSKEYTIKKSSRGKADVVSLPAPPFYVETKWDGERFQIHFDGHEYKYLSRRAFDFTQKFNETLTPKLRQQIKSGVQSFILDGEMMAFHKKHRIFTQKGYNIDVKTINKDNPNHCPVFVAFDLIYYNGLVLTKLPLKERLDKLKKIFEAKEDVIRFSEVKLMHTKDEVIECLNSAIDDGEEGLIAKDMNSQYEPGKRLVTWLKIKPEYLEDNSVDDLDLVILGAYYTESTRRGGELSHFLVGLLDTSKGKKEYYPVAKVGSGRLRSLAVKDLIAELQPKLTQTPMSNVHIKTRKKPDFMIDPSKSIVVQVKASEIIPSDVYACNYTLRFPRITKIRRDKSPSEIMEVKEFLRIRDACGGKLAKRTDGAGGKSNHPFFRKKRQHSDFEDSDNDADQPQSKRTATTTDYNNDQEIDDEIEELLPGPSKTLLSINRPKVILGKSPTKITASASSIKRGPGSSVITPKALSVQNNLFSSKVFCVYGSSSWKTGMETKIRQHGGQISQNPDIKDFFAIIGERRTSVLVRKAVQSEKYNVLQPSWIEKCLKSGEEVPTVPLDYWAMTKDTRDKFSDEYDEYGDSYTKENTVEETKTLIKRILEDEDEEDKKEFSSSPSVSPQKSSNSNQQMSESSETDDGNCTDSGSSTDFSETDLMEDMFPSKEDGVENNVKWGFMSGVVVTFRGAIDDVLQTKLQFFGGKVVSDENEASLSHVILSRKGVPSKEDHSRAIVVSQEWLEDCLKKKQVLDERHYIAT